MLKKRITVRMKELESTHFLPQFLLLRESISSRLEDAVVLIIRWAILDWLFVDIFLNNHRQNAILTQLNKHYKWTGHFKNTSGIGQICYFALKNLSLEVLICIYKCLTKFLWYLKPISLEVLNLLLQQLGLVKHISSTTPYSILTEDKQS